MEKLKRSERVAAVTRLFCREPGRLFTLRELVELFGCAKSTLSEDITSVRNILKKYGLGNIESVNGAAGGVRFYPINEETADKAFILSLCSTLSSPDRILPDGFLYVADLFSDARMLSRLSEIFVKKFYQLHPDVIITTESSGVPIALMVSQALGKPMVVARHNSAYVSDGSVMAVNYLSDSGKTVNCLSLPNRSLSEGLRALIIGERLTDGSTFYALCALMQEFGVEVCGMGVIISEKEPVKKKVDGVYSLITLETADDKTYVAEIYPTSGIFMAKHA